jgi:hypothetical protein
MGFLNYPDICGLNRFVLHRDFSRRTSKIKSSGFAAAMWAHSYLAMTH